MEKNIPEERWALINCTENSAKSTVPEEDDDEEEEALSLCDLPQIHHSKENEEQSTLLRAIESQEDFDFCSLPKESEMCAADEVFFQGQILPLSRSISSTKEIFSQYKSGSRNFSRSISRSESMDRYSSSGLITSRSSSISSGHSSSSGSGSSTAAAAADPKSRPSQNPFQYSHPSPSPRLRNFPSNKRGIATINSKSAKRSSSWNVFRLGLLTTPPEIEFHDLKNRPRNSTNRTNFGSRNSSSTSTNSSSSISSSGKKRMFKPKALFGACKCTFGAVDTVPSKVVIIKRSASDSECEMRPLRAEEENNAAIKSPKKRLSNHRTFEWLKQLSLEGAADD